MLNFNLEFTRRRMELSMAKNITKEAIKQQFIDTLQKNYNISPDEASDKQVYKTLSSIVVNILKEKRRHFITNAHSLGKKQVYYLSMEFLMGRSLKTCLYNLEIAEEVRSVLKDFGVNLNRIYECEPDAGLGNGGLGRLAACYLDALATQAYPARLLYLL